MQVVRRKPGATGGNRDANTLRGLLSVTKPVAGRPHGIAHGKGKVPQDYPASPEAACGGGNAWRVAVRSAGFSALS